MSTNLNHLRVLIVDDDRSARFILQRILVNMLDCIVKEAAHGAEAFRHLRSDVFDLVFLDVSMPGQDGVSVLRQIRSDSQWTNLPVAMLSAVRDKSVILELKELGISDYFLKPLDMDESVERIRALLKAIRANRTHQEQNTPP